MPKILQLLFPGILWKGENRKNAIYLTFDDGPIPEVTPWVLDTLAEYDAKATFFMVGDNCRKYPKVLARVREAGHTVGNHTFSHLQGWSTDNASYFDDFQLADEILGEPQRKYFRPPYGQMKLSQLRNMRKRAKVVMWDVLSGDFDKRITPKRCLHKSIRHTRPGSVIVFHDSIKTSHLLKQVLPQYLSYFSSMGFKFEAL